VNLFQKKLIVALLLFAGAILVLLGVAIITKVIAAGGHLSEDLIPLAILDCLCIVICVFAGLFLAFEHGIDEGKKKGMGQPIPIEDLPNNDTFVSLKSFSEINGSGNKTGNSIHLLRNGRRELILVVLPTDRIVGSFQVIDGQITDFVSMNPVGNTLKAEVVSA